MSFSKTVLVHETVHMCESTIFSVSVSTLCEYAWFSVIFMYPVSVFELLSVSMQLRFSVNLSEYECLKFQLI